MIDTLLWLSYLLIGIPNEKLGSRMFNVSGFCKHGFQRRILNFDGKFVGF